MSHRGWSNYYTWCVWIEMTNIAPNYKKVKEHKEELENMVEDKFKEFMKENINFLVDIRWEKVDVKQIQKRLSYFNRI